MSDAVNHPSHYGGDAIYETIKVLEAWLTPEQFIGFCRGNAIKYSSRAGKKGDPAEDTKKAAFYSNYEADFRERLANGHIGEERVILLGAVLAHDSGIAIAKQDGRANVRGAMLSKEYRIG